MEKAGWEDRWMRTRKRKRNTTHDTGDSSRGRNPFHRKAQDYRRRQSIPVQSGPIRGGGLHLRMDSRLEIPHWLGPVPRQKEYSPRKARADSGRALAWSGVRK